MAKAKKVEKKKKKGKKAPPKDKKGKAFTKAKEKLKAKPRGKGTTAKKQKKNKKRKKVPLHRFPKRRKFTDPLWLIPILFWGLLTLALCVVCSQFSDFTWLTDFTSLNEACSEMHRHLVGYLLTYQSYLIALVGAVVMSLVYCIVLERITRTAIRVTWYLTILPCTAYVLSLWFVVPVNHKLTCGQSIFSIGITISYIGFIFLMINYRQRLPIVESLHLFARDLYRDLPTIRIGLVTFLFQFLFISLNVFSMAIAVSVLQKNMELANRILTLIYSICFMVLEGWMFLIVNTCNKFAAGYTVGLWYFAKKKSKVKGTGRCFTVMWNHIATIATGSIYLFLHTIFHPIINSLYYGGSSTGVEGMIKTAVTLVLQPYRNTYDTINGYGFYIVAIYGIGYYPAMKRSLNLRKVGETNALQLMGDSFVYICILFVSCTTLFFGLAFNPSERMHWWKNIVLLFFTGLWVSLSFLLTYKHMLSALYMCLCMDYEVNDGRKRPHKYGPKLAKYLGDKHEFALLGRLRFRKGGAKKQRRKPVFAKGAAKVMLVDEKGEKKKAEMTKKKTGKGKGKKAFGVKKGKKKK